MGFCQISNLVTAKPADRYKAISHFIDVSHYEQAENSLRMLIRQVERDIDQAVTRVSENRESVENFWNKSGRPGIDALEWANSEIKKDRSVFAQRRQAIENLSDSYRRLRDYPAELEKCLGKVKDKSAEIDQLEQDIIDLNESVAAEYLEVLDILRSSEKYFQNHPSPEACPLCESSENVDGLSQRVKEQIQAFEEGNRLRTLKESLERKRSDLDRLGEGVEELRKRASDDAERFALSMQCDELPNEISLPSSPPPDDLGSWHKWLEDSHALLDEWKQISDDLVDSKRFLEALDTALKVLAENSQVKEDLELLLPRLRESLSVMEGERKKYTDGILEQIGREVERLYEEVHPGEGLNKISLALHQSRRASLEMTTSFLGETDSPPQAYFSDSHLDTLGLCVFLVLALKDSPENAILVLDDVLGSVDEPHVERLIEMLYSEAIKFRQCIITTHYKPWKQKLRWGWLKNGQCQFVELNKWASSSGISLMKSMPDIARLRELLTENPPDPQLVCSKAGVILEAALDFLTLLYECKIPRRASGLYTLGDLLPAIDKKLKAALRVEHIKENSDGTISYVEKVLKPHLDELHRIAQARNVFGCHFNAISFDMLDTDAVAFGREVLALMDCLVDEEAGWPRNDKSGSYWANSGETRRLHPLKKPR